MKTVLFACVHNAGRSQMASAFFNRIAARERAIGVSAGTQPASVVHAEVIAAMAELGIDIANVKPRKFTAELASQAQLLITMGCGEACPFSAGLEVEDWPLTDPKGQSADAVRAIRDEVKRRVERLVRERGWN